MSLYKGDTYISGSLAIDSVLSSTSENAVQNKAVDAAIKAVLPSGGSAGNVLTKTSTGQAWSGVNAYTKAESDALLATKQGKITYGTAVPTGGSDGDVYIQYEA